MCQNFLFFILSAFTSDRNCPKISYFGLLSYVKYDMNVQLKPGFLQRIALCLTKMSDNNSYVHFSGVRFS